ncbi:Sensor histidine kinase TmoS [termite gut metagenome]|uniref:histidine kinase n=1 Tax=termite gut metagenome TaxID=433724 RepID=A0A5J4RSH9_9ZZZZ
MKQVLKLLALLCFLPLKAQTYKYIGLEDGLSDRQVHYILKDKRKYIWFLTEEGIDKYNGTEFKQYKPTENGKTIEILQNVNWLHVDKDNEIWGTGKSGKVFRYDEITDRFQLKYKIPEQEINLSSFTLVSYSFIDNNQNLWLCTTDKIYLYPLNEKKEDAIYISNVLKESVTNVAQQDSTHFFLGTENGVRYAELKANGLELIPLKGLDGFIAQVNDMYYHPATQQLFIGTFQKGIFVYNLEEDSYSQPQTDFSDVSVNRIKPFEGNDILIATDGAGIYKINAVTRKTEPYIVTDYNQNNLMNGNKINDIYIDNRKRIWMANDPVGITIKDDRYMQYKWIKHYISNKQSLINDYVNAIIEDSDGDLWFGTQNGISLYKTKTDYWQSFLSSFNPPKENKNHIFTTLCEISPGIIWAGGHNASLYEINKRDQSVKLLNSVYTPDTKSKYNKYVSSIIKDSQGYIWLGGYHNIKRLNLNSKDVRVYSDIHLITSLVEKDNASLWVSTATGLYMLDKESGKVKQVKLSENSEPIYVNTIYRMDNDRLFIGTNGAGLIIYDAKKDSLTRYNQENSSIISDRIYTILSDRDKNIMLSTENGLSRYYPSDNSFHNWTKDRGLITNHFNANSGVLFKNKYFIFGSVNGAVEFEKTLKLPENYATDLIFSDFKVFYNTIVPKEPGSPLEKDINETETIHLSHSQNIFSLEVSTINYDYPSNIIYSWMLEGFYNEWSKSGNERVIRFTNLNSGKYTLHVRAISNEDKRTVIQERSIGIIIDVPFWASGWAILIYVVILLVIFAIIVHILLLNRQKKISGEKISFFINTAHDIRTPLTLIKVPLEEVQEVETLSPAGEGNVKTALRNVNLLLRLTTNLINFEKTDLHSSELHISEYEINSFLEEIVTSFRSYAETRRIELTCKSDFPYLNVWFDKEKMDSVFRNLLSNALKYTPENGKVAISLMETADKWSMEIKDTGIGIPSSEQKKLFKIHFRGSNAVNLKVSGSGIGLILVWKLVNLHKGKITIHSAENRGCVIKTTFFKGNKHLRNAKKLSSEKETNATPNSGESNLPIYNTIQEQQLTAGQKILIVEDNDELRDYLRQTLSSEYIAQTCTNGKEALSTVKEYSPDLIISDIMMPEMQGDEMCSILKNDIETSHIPIILLTALTNEKQVLEGIKTGADEYVVKPFNIGILKAMIANLLINRAILRKKYGNPDAINENEDENDLFNYSNNIDWKFITTVKKNVETKMDDPSFNVDTLCAMLNMSRTSFYNKIKSLTDHAPADYVRIIRLNKAAQLLKDGNYNVTEIAEMTGFNDAKYFREVFKKHFNVNPTKYKELNG